MFSASHASSQREPPATFSSSVDAGFQEGWHASQDHAHASKMDDLWVAVKARDDLFVLGDDSRTAVGTSLPTATKRSQDKSKALRNQKKSRTKQ